MLSGVMIGTIEFRILTLTISAAPYITNIIKDNQSIVDNEKIMVATPKTIVEYINIFPAFLIGGSCVKSIPVTTPPTAGIERSIPRPSGPILSISTANTGNIPIIPLNRTAARSIVIVPKTILVFQTYAKPPNNILIVIFFKFVAVFGFCNKNPKITYIKKLIEATK
jgi:hypothetical protein